MPINQDDNNNWLSTRRKRKRPPQTTDALSTKPTQQSTGDASIPAANSSSSSSSPSPLPLDWTKLPPCHIKKPQRRINDAANDIPPLEKLTGRAIFFFPSSNSDIPHPDDDDDPTWFQGRFFPQRNDVLAHSPPTLSWGMMGIQTPVVDECLRCSEGGYRRVDLTVIRYAGANTTTNDEAERSVRWKAEGLTWTGGDMMRLSAAPFAAFVDGDGTGVEFDPTMIVEGTKAVEMAEKYFPSLVGRMREEDSDEFGEEALVVVGNMEMVVPKSFAERRGREDDDDGLWYD